MVFYQIEHSLDFLLPILGRVKSTKFFSLQDKSFQTLFKNDSFCLFNFFVKFSCQALFWISHKSKLYDSLNRIMSLSRWFLHDYSNKAFGNFDCYQAKVFQKTLADRNNLKTYSLTNFSWSKYFIKIANKLQ